MSRIAGSVNDDARGDRLARRAGRLHDVVLEDRRAGPSVPEDGDREHRDRDRGRHGQADLEREVDARGGEQRARARAQHEGADVSSARDRVAGRTAGRPASREQMSGASGSPWESVGKGEWLPESTDGGRDRPARPRSGGRTARVTTLTATTDREWYCRGRRLLPPAGTEQIAGARQGWTARVARQPSRFPARNLGRTSCCGPSS